MSEYESENFEIIVEDLIAKKNPREELDSRYGGNEQRKLQAVQYALKILRNKKNDLDSIDAPHLSSEDLDTLSFIDEDIKTFEMMEEELTVVNDQTSEDKSVIDYTDKDIA